MDSVLICLITALSTNLAAFIGAWVTWRCLKPEPLMSSETVVEEEEFEELDFEEDFSDEAFDESR